MSLEYTKIQELLTRHYVDNSNVFTTHVSMIQPKGKFQFNRKDLEDFWNVYCKSIKKTEPNSFICGIAEKPQQYLPVLVDIDIKIKDSTELDFGDHIYTNQHVQAVIEIYQTVLRDIVDQITDRDLLCVVLEKPIYYLTSGDNMFAKNGFHLHFPNIFLSKVDQEIYLLPRIQAKLTEQDVFADLGYEDSASVLDKSYCTNPWLLYGSRKSEDMDPYTVSYVMDADGQRLSVEKAFSKYQLFDMNEKMIKINGNVDEYLPRILSIIPYGRQTKEIRHGVPTLLKEKLREKNVKKNISVSVQEALSMSAKLLPMIADYRVEDRNEWMTIGWALYNISEGSEEGLNQWLEFSSRSQEKYDEATCIYEWEKMIKKDITLGTLHYYASIDNPEKYTEYKISRSKDHMYEALNGSHNDIAKMLFAEYGTEFVCASFSARIWYQFKQHHWEEIDEGVYLRSKISSDIVNHFSEIGKKTLSEKYGESDKIKEASHNMQLKLINKMIANLKSAAYKDKVMRECAEVFFDERFKQKLNKNPYIIGFQNGVYDLKLNEFRAGRPEDFISKLLPINYREFKPGDNEIEMIEDFFIRVFPDESLRKYFLDVYSDIFVGGNTFKKVFMWIGEQGDNAKSTLDSLFEEMLGDLAIKVTTAYFSGKKIQAGQHNADLARAGPPVRHFVCVEANAKEKIKNGGDLKSLSGNDKFWARDAHEKGKEVKEIRPMFMMTWIGNKAPDIEDADEPMWNRFRVIPFESVFVRPGKPCPATFKEQLAQKRFPMDLKFNEKIPTMLEPLAWYLLEWRKKVTVIVEPPKVLAATEMYRRRNDLYRQFLEECTTKDEKSTIHLSVLYSRFKDWFKEAFPGSNIPVKNNAEEYFIKAWGTQDYGKSWNGYRLKTLQDDLQSGNAHNLEDDDLVNYDSKTSDQDGSDQTSKKSRKAPL